MEPKPTDNKLTPEEPKLANIEEPVEALTVAASLNGKTLKALFQNRNFVPLLLGQLVSYIGDQFTLIACLAVITPLVGESSSGLAVALLAMALAIPQILFGLIGGVLVDKWNRKATMIGSDVTRALAMFSLLAIAGDSSRLWIMYLSIFVIGIAQTLFYPARASALPAVVQRRFLAGANALLEAGFVIALILGAGVAGLMVHQFGADFAFAFNGSAYLFSALMILMMQIPRHKIASTAPSAGGFALVWRELRDGLAYIWHTRSMRYIMGLSIMVAASLGAVIILVLDYLNKTLKIGADGFGIVIGILGIGIVIGGILIQRLSKFLPTNRLVALAMVLDGVAVSAFVLHPAFGLVLITTAFIGFSVIIARGVLSTLTQAIPPEEFRGRVQGAFNLIFSAPFTLSIGLAGVLVTYVSQELVFAGFGITLLLTAWLAVNMLRGIDDAIYSAENS